MAGRSYQLEALTRITEEFDQYKKRKTLLVMATGTGKTRTAIALIDLLKRANWVKRVLFLADRNALLTQVLRALKVHLPTVTPIDLTKDKAIETGNVVLSTYPTIFNAINRNDSNQHFISPGHFDLVIVDEAHRSIYQKYRFLFEYFDSLLVGLTATPREEIHRDTYQIFDLEPGVPSFAYELSDAVTDGYLVPPRGVNVPFRFLSRGINYDDLSPEEQQEYEATFLNDTTGEMPPAIEPNALNHWLFNLNTIDQTLELLMEKGLRIEGGDRLGKTIIFARNHEHANFIVQRFDHNYPHLKGKFAQVIDSHNSYAQALLDDFSEPHKEPTIAVSVDMLDTGVDIPEVVNLVFFKPVYSRVKFNQMIGRGTRCCPDLFGVGQHKQEFLVFDLCGNFDFFNQDIQEPERKPPEALSTRLVKTRLQLAQALKNHSANDEEEQTQLKDNLLDHLHQHVANMEQDNFLVRRHLEAVETFSQRERWENLSDDDIDTIREELAPLPNKLPREKELAKRFDLLCLKLQLSIVKQDHQFTQYRDQIRDLVTQLETKQNIPMVKEQLPLIEEVKVESWWEDVTLGMVEYVRQQLRI
ncbi:DEAD/DEAH box helicase family protein [Euhalothece natronophila]|uniref:DEAD/DEAH box helicase family protein n=1 Tax=Euhalothece natronophila TaxID=577489 RepID=UPI0028F4526F|nr:DEAD/DEAH box helicase family protein [Euhalothece natronophila]